MFTEGKILVCTDFSATADLALKVAKNLSDKSYSTLHIMHVCKYPMEWDWSVDESLTNYLSDKFEVELIIAAKKRLNQQMESLGIKGETHVTLGAPYQAIHALIKEKGITLLIMGHQGKGGTAFHLGSLAAKMMASAPIPVLLVKKELETYKVAGLVDPTVSMKEIIAATEELSVVLATSIEFVSLFADPAVRSRVGKMGLSPKLLSLDEEEKNEIIKFMTELIRRELPPHLAVTIRVEISLEKKLAYHLNAILSQDHTDIVVMKRHQSQFLEKILIGSETRRMVEIFAGNLLILPPT